MSWIYLARIPSLDFEPEPLNAFKIIEATLRATFEQKPLEHMFRNNQTTPLPQISFQLMRVVKMEAWISLNRCFDNIGPSIADCNLAFAQPVIERSLVIAKNITELEHNQQLDIQHQQHQ
jgi:hypothetical protein